MRALIKYEDNCVKVTHYLLKEFRNSASLRQIRLYLSSHLNRDSLLSISDLLAELGMTTRAVKVPSYYLNKVPVPFIAPINQGNHEEDSFTVIRAISDNTVCLLDDKSCKWIDVDKDRFAAQWTGIALLVARNDRTDSQASFFLAGTNENNSARPLLMGVMGILTFLLSFYFLRNTGSNRLLVFLLEALNLLGAVSSFLLMQIDLGYYNKITTRLCNANAKTDCHTVLDSAGSTILGIKWSTLGMSYFCGNLIVHLFCGLLFPTKLMVPLTISAFSLGFIGYSLYFQAFLAKKWCVLCLVVQFVLFAEFLLLAGAGQYNFRITGNFVNFIFSGLENLLVYLAVFYFLNFIVLPQGVYMKESRFKLSVYRRYLFKPATFQHLLSQEREIDLPDPTMGILLGNVSGPVEILKICNPYCRSCAKTQLELMALLRSKSTLKVQLIFLTFTTNNNLGKNVISHFMNLSRLENKDSLMRALNFWYAAASPDYQQLVELYPLSGQPVDFDQEISDMQEWCSKRGFTETPVYFVSGRRLPEVYDIKDLKYIV